MLKTNSLSWRLVTQGRKGAFPGLPRTALRGARRLMQGSSPQKSSASNNNETREDEIRAPSLAAPPARWWGGRQARGTERPVAPRGRQPGRPAGWVLVRAQSRRRAGGQHPSRQQPHPPQTNKSQRKGGEGRRKDENRLGEPRWKTQLLKNVVEPAGRVSNDVW